MGDLWRRLVRLATGRYVWVDTEDGSETVEHMSWKHRWRLDGPQSWKWWWVQRWGHLDCGCTRNPLTRRFILYAGSPRCPHNHAKFNSMLYDMFGDDDV